MRSELTHPTENYLARTGLGNGYVVSTIYLSSEIKELDKYIVKFASKLNVSDDKFLDTRGKEYETMVFKADPDNEFEILDWSGCDIATYSSETEALVGHQEMVNKWIGL